MFPVFFFVQRLVARPCVSSLSDYNTQRIAGNAARYGYQISRKATGDGTPCAFENNTVINTVTCATTNTCTCGNGTAAEGDSCTEDGEICASCNTGYALDSDTKRCAAICGPDPFLQTICNDRGTYNSSTETCDCNSGFTGDYCCTVATAAAVDRGALQIVDPIKK